MDDDSTYVIIKKSKVEVKYINMDESKLEVNEVNEVTKEVKEVINEVINVTNIVSTFSEKIKKGLEMISESKLTEDQKKLATYIYDSTKKEVQSFISDRSFNNTIKITMMIGQLIKQLESVKIDGKEPTGADKKLVAIQLGRILIKEVTPDDKEVEIFIIYDTIAEPTLEAMIDVSKVVNVEVREIVTKCCPTIVELFKALTK